jgi:hypothetical protein
MASGEQFLTKRYEKWNNFQVRVCLTIVLRVC